MFIDTDQPTTRAPAERNGSRDDYLGCVRFRSSGARRNLLEIACSINITSLWDEGNLLEESC
jgi:hypothetical protein